MTCWMTWLDDIDFHVVWLDGFKSQQRICVKFPGKPGKMLENLIFCERHKKSIKTEQLVLLLLLICVLIKIPVARLMFIFFFFLLLKKLKPFCNIYSYRYQFVNPELTCRLTLPCSSFFFILLHSGKFFPVSFPNERTPLVLQVLTHPVT